MLSAHGSSVNILMIELGLLSEGRTGGNQRYYSDQDLVYLKRIMELKSLGFTLDEISRIIKLKEEDQSGNKRRTELLSQYRSKLSQSMERMSVIQSHIDELKSAPDLPAQAASTRQNAFSSSKSENFQKNYCIFFPLMVCFY